MSGNTAFDIIVIGAGPAGYTAALKAAELGKKVLVIEREAVGGTCLNWGCIPTKTFLKNAEIIESLKQAGKRGIEIKDSSFSIDMGQTVAMKNGVVKTLTTGISGLFKARGIETVMGEAVLLDSRRVQAGNTVYTAQKIIWAGGSKSFAPPIKGLDHPNVLTSKEMLDLDRVPENLVIIGGGVIGVEMANIFRAFGSNVTIVELAPRILPFADPEVSQVLSRSFKKQKINMETGIKVEEIAKSGNDLRVILSDGRTLDCDTVLVAIGRTPDLAALGSVGVTIEKNKVVVNDRMETSVEGLYAPGDINGLSMLAHAAFQMGEVAAVNACGGDAKSALSYVPAAVYTIPELAWVGLTEEEASKRSEISIGKFPFSANGRALGSGENTGFVKVIADKKYNQILGIHIAGPSAAEMINEASALLSLEATVEDVMHIIHAHPTYSEAVFEASADVLGLSLHLPPKK